MSAAGAEGLFPKTISKRQATDTGMAMVLILLLIGLLTKQELYWKLAIPAVILTMAIPMFFYPIAFVWFGLSNILATVSSKVILSAVFLLLVFPVGAYRRMIGKDSLRLKGFKQSRDPVMKTRDHEFTASDIETPY